MNLSVMHVHTFQHIWFCVLYIVWRNEKHERFAKLNIFRTSSDRNWIVYGEKNCSIAGNGRTHDDRCEVYFPSSTEWKKKYTHSCVVVVATVVVVCSPVLHFDGWFCSCVSEVLWESAVRVYTHRTQLEHVDAIGTSEVISHSLPIALSVPVSLSLSLSLALSVCVFKCIYVGLCVSFSRIQKHCILLTIRFLYHTTSIHISFTPFCADRMQYVKRVFWFDVHVSVVKLYSCVVVNILFGRRRRRKKKYYFGNHWSTQFTCTFENSVNT